MVDADEVMPESGTRMRSVKADGYTATLLAQPVGRYFVSDSDFADSIVPRNGTVPSKQSIINGVPVKTLNKKEQEQGTGRVWTSVRRPRAGVIGRWYEVK